MSRATHLKIKIKTLAVEAQFIRKEERAALKAARHGASRVEDGREGYPDRHYRDYESLREHRTGIVRSAARVNNLAYGFLRGHAYSDMESKTNSEVDLVAVHKLVKRFGTRADLERWPEWEKATTAYLDAQKPPVANLASQKPPEANPASNFHLLDLLA